MRKYLAYLALDAIGNTIRLLVLSVGGSVRCALCDERVNARTLVRHAQTQHPRAMRG